MSLVPYTFGRALPVATRSEKSPRREAERPGVPDHGRIVKLYIGQGYGFIRQVDEREVYFHRGALEHPPSINNYQVGDRVSFERVEDPISGPRARCVQRIDSVDSQMAR